MEELWRVSCEDGAEEKWARDVCLSGQDMIMLLRLLFCRKLEHHEIIDSVAGKRDLLEVRLSENGTLWTPQGGLLHYTARRI